MLSWIQTNGWAITLIGVLVNLAWNLYNQKRTTRLQDSVRTSSVELEEFRSRVRAPIETALFDLTSGRNTLRSLASSGKSLEDLRTEVGTQWQAIVDAHARLSDALVEADRSSFASTQGWAKLTEAPWDKAATSVDTALSPVRGDSETREALKEVVDTLTALMTAVRNQIDSEVRKHVRR